MNHLSTLTTWDKKKVQKIGETLCIKSNRVYVVNLNTPLIESGFGKNLIEHSLYIIFYNSHN